MDFLELTGKTILVFGVANRKSVAYHIGQLLTEAGAKVIYSVRSPERKQSVAKLLPDTEVYVCDVERPDEIEVELRPCYGLDGFIRAKKVTVSYRPGLPDAKEQRGKP